VLRLNSLRPLDEATDAADYGSLVHAGLHHFLAERHALAGRRGGRFVAGDGARPGEADLRGAGRLVGRGWSGSPLGPDWRRSGAARPPVAR
jgi:hypothetical protein